MTTLHHVPFSRSFRVLWMLEEMGVDADIVSYRLTDGSLRKLADDGTSPAGRIPALEIDNRQIFESSAILEYLCESRPGHGFGRAPGHPERIAYLQALSYAETMASLIENLNINHLFLRDRSQVSPSLIKLLTARLRATLAGFSQMIADDYILQGGFSAADVMMGFNLFAAPYYVRLDAFPDLQTYRKRLEARPAFQAARAKDGEQEFYSQDFYPVPEG